MQINISKDFKTIKGFVNTESVTPDISLWKNHLDKWVSVNVAPIIDYEQGKEQLALYNAVFAKAYKLE